MRTSDFEYELPQEFIAQSPIEPRDAARMMVLDRKNGSIQHTRFNELGRYLHPQDLLVLNETRVIPARLYAHKIPSGGKVELLLLNRRDANTWEVLAGGKGLFEGRRLQVQDGPTAEITGDLGGARRLVHFGEQVDHFLEAAGHVPLPPYIHEKLSDAERYQTVYAKQPGSAAAPTAGLHFTTRLIQELESQGIPTVKVSLHVGLDTFTPVTEEDPTQHHIHTEWCQLAPDAARAINYTRQQGGRIVAVGTTCVRTLESAAKGASPGEAVAQIEGPTGLFILPGYPFKVVDAMITNFHLPRSTLLMLVSAFAGRDLILNAYQIAKNEGYRFYSFGDAMLIL